MRTWTRNAKNFASGSTGSARGEIAGLIDIDDMGLGAFGLAALIGLLIGNIKIPLTSQGLSGTCFFAHYNRRRADCFTCVRPFFHI